MLSRFVVPTTCLVLALVSACSEDTPAGSPASVGGAPSPANDGPPAIQLIGRFDTSTPDHPRTAWPGGRIVARFSGTSASATLSQTPGDSDGNTWLNVLVDGAFSKKVEIRGENQVVDLASGLESGAHVVELEKRTEANRGVLTLEKLSFDDGELLAPPARKTRRVEFVGDSTIDGFGAEGDVNTTCNGESPAELDDVRKSAAHFTATALDAESHVLAYSGKGLVGGETGGTFPPLYERTLPDDATSSWDFSTWTPDVVVISLGGQDVESGTAAPGFQAAYDELVTTIRTKHPNAHIFMTVWSQIKDLPPANARTALRTVLDAIAAAHASDEKLHVFQWNEADYPTDETGCAEHANEAHGRETANELAPAIKTALGWN
jgi:hypothetical protein